jgi:hypothetical protein
MLADKSDLIISLYIEIDNLNNEINSLNREVDNLYRDLAYNI